MFGFYRSLSVLIFGFAELKFASAGFVFVENGLLTAEWRPRQV